MAISNDLFLAILAMDAYNRGYNGGLQDGEGSKDGDGNDIDGIGGLGSKIGTATLDKQSDPEPESNAVALSFYAAAYDWEGKTVISYRGTDSMVDDFLTGWLFGTVVTAGTQLEIGREFYETAKGSFSAFA